MRFRGIRSHLLSDGDQAQRLRDQLAALPEHVAPLPDIGRGISRLMEHLNEQAQHTAACVRSVEDALQKGCCSCDGNHRGQASTRRGPVLTQHPASLT